MKMPNYLRRHEGKIATVIAEGFEAKCISDLNDMASSSGIFGKNVEVMVYQVDLNFGLGLI